MDLGGGAEGVIKVCHSFVEDNVDPNRGADGVKVCHIFVEDNVDQNGGRGMINTLIVTPMVKSSYIL